jgi:hypothetical protein
MSNDTDTATEPLPVKLSTNRVINYRPWVDAKNETSGLGILKRDSEGNFRPVLPQQGVNVRRDLVGPSLPKHFTVLGTKVELVPFTSKNDETGVKGRGTIEVDGEAKVISLKITERPDVDGYNLQGKVTPKPVHSGRPVSVQDET